jgi:ubiquinone/menaquinone biosynthesis C-methylase UbiE
MTGRREADLRTRHVPPSAADYRASHAYAGKGLEYDQYYSTDPWQQFLWAREQLILRQVISDHFRGKDVHLLDFACGTGRISSFLENLVNSATGVDLSEPMLEIARQKLRRTRVIVADITSSPILDSERFNFITAFRFFTNAQPTLRKVVMAKLAALLTPDGILVFNNHQNADSLYWSLTSAAYRIRGKAWPESFRLMTRSEAVDLVEGAGLRLLAVKPVGFGHFPKIPLSRTFAQWTEDTAAKYEWLHRYSESMTVVCSAKC